MPTSAPLSIEELRAAAYPLIDPRRLPHVAGCEKAAVTLARRWGVDEDAALRAAILHDITKRLSPDEQLQLCSEYGIICDKYELGNHRLLHAKTAAALARERFGEPPELCRAIELHTTGDADMTALEKLIYLADCIEETRSFPALTRLRELALSDMDGAMLLALELSLEKLRRQGIRPHPRTKEALDFLIKRNSIKEE